MTYPNPPPPPPTSSESFNTLFLMRARLDAAYVKTLPGILRILVMIFSIIILICIQNSPFRSNSRGLYLTLLALITCVFSIVMLMMYVGHVVERYPGFCWLKLEIVGDIIMVVMHMIGSTIAVAFGAVSFSAAGFFGYLLMVCCAADACLKIGYLQDGVPAQPFSVVVKPPPPEERH